MKIVRLTPSITKRIESKEMKANLFLSSSKWSGFLSAMLVGSPEATNGSECFRWENVSRYGSFLDHAGNTTRGPHRTIERKKIYTATKTNLWLLADTSMHGIRPVQLSQIV